MESKKSFEVNLPNEFSLNNHAYLFLLYRPLIGLKACELYEILLALGKSSNAREFKELCLLCGMSEAQIDRNREQLEKLSLLNTYLDKEADHYIFYLYPCKEPRLFLQDEVYARFLIQKASPDYFSSMLDLFIVHKEPENCTNISKKLSLKDLEEDWKDEQEEFFQSHKIVDRKAVTGFDWESFLRNLDRILPERLKSDENLNHIASLADFYGIDEKQVKRLLPRAINDARTSIDFALLEKLIASSIKFVPEEETELYELSPVRFMRKIYPGVPLFPAEKEFLKELVEEFGFSYPLSNFLLEEMLKACHNIFNIKYGQKMAASWKRSKITTIEEAKAQIENRNQYKKKQAGPEQLPEWSKAKKENVEDPELAAKLQTELSELFGEL